MLIKRERLPIKQIALTGLLPSFFKKIFYRLKGYKIGKNVFIGLGSVIIGKNVHINDNTKIGFLSVIRANEISIGRFVTIGSMVYIDTEKVFIDDDARINENVIIAGITFPDSVLRLGKRTIIMEYSFINPTKPIQIGDDSGIGGHCLLFTHGSWLSQLDGYPVTFAPITIGKNVWLPWRVFIMPGVTIGDNVVIGANSLVNRSVPSNCLIAGSPAKIISEDYPSPITEERRIGIFDNIISNFNQYLVHNGFTVEQKDNHDGFVINVNKRSIASSLIYSKTGNTSEPCNRDSVVILDNANDNSSYGNYKMVVNLRNKTRIGTSLIGEEFVSYLFRYGMRFNRLD
jgi:acetyltransferase-like isoleucine patch superfamily enzyme